MMHLMTFPTRRKFYQTCFLVWVMAAFGPSLAAQQPLPTKVSTLKAYHKGTTAPLRDLKPQAPTARKKQDLVEDKFLPPNFLEFERPKKTNPNALPLGDDPLRFSKKGPKLLTAEPRVVIEGISEDDTDVTVPDNNGDVSPTHYIEIINASWFQIFAKDGTPLTQPLTANTIWNQIGKSSFSDPVIQYDEVAERWLITDLADVDEVLYGVSKTSDPMGSWDLYSFNAPGWADYPKYGIWPNAYILTVNEGGDFYPIYAFNRQQMLSGAAAIDVQRIEVPAVDGQGFPTATPMDWNGLTPPPTNEVFVARINDDGWGESPEDVIEVWGFTVDWNNPDNTVAQSTIIPTAPFDSDGCSINDNFSYACIPQPNTDSGIDGIMTIIMNRIVYRNFGTHESAVLTFSVDAGNDVSGVRWAELRRTPGQPWTLYQEGTVGPDDGVHRFIGSIAINNSGDIALGYCVSGTANFPSLRYTGRRASDPLGEMTVEEVEFATGTNSRPDGFGYDRYGDYAAMTVDPSDDSFWFVGEYVKEDGSFGTKIVNFALRKDTLDITPVALLSPQTGSGLTNTEPVSIQVKNVGLEAAKDISVGYVMNNGAVVIEPATVSELAPDAVYTHTFGPKVDMSALGDYKFKVFATFPQDQNAINDTLRLTRSNIPFYDIELAAINGFEKPLCSTDFPATLLIKNNGTKTITSLKITYKLDNQQPVTVLWTTNLQSGQSSSYILAFSLANGGNHHLEVSISEPNGQVDEVPGNNSLSKDFEINDQGETVQLTLTFDLFPEETSWQLSDVLGNVLYEGSDYGGMEEETIVVDWCLKKDECYDFIIYDEFGDGVTNDWGPDGFYSITRSDGSVITSIINANFGFEEFNSFCVTPACNLIATTSITNATTGTSFDGAILIQVTSGTAPFLYSINGGQTFSSNALFSGLAPGIYQIIVQDANDCLFTSSAQVHLSVSGVNDPQSKYVISVAPNPSESGIFEIQVNGIENNLQTLDVQVLDAQGKTIQYQSLAGINDAYKGMISLYAQPAGVYYVRFKNGGISDLVRVVRL